MKSQASILVIDDEQGIRDMLTFELTEEGFEVEAAENGMLAMEAFKRRKFDIAITDLKMPGMNGVETMEALRKLDPDIQVIVGTGYATVETAVTCMKLGAYDYIEKPYELNELKLLLERAMEKSHLQSAVALYEASRGLLATLKYEDLVKLVVDLASRALRADAVSLVVERSDGKGTELHRLDEGVPSDPLLEVLMRRALAAGTPLRLSSSDNTDHSPLDLAAEGFHSALAFPLVGGKQRHWGSLILLRGPGLPVFSPSELHQGAIFASQISLAIDNALLYEELEQKIFDLVTTRERLVQTEKLALAGHMAGCVAHEINNPLSVVLAGLEALQDYFSTVDRLLFAATSAATYMSSQQDLMAQALARSITTIVDTDDLADNWTRDIADIVEELLIGVKRISDLVSGFKQLANAPEPESPEATDVNLVVDECITNIASTNGNYCMHSRGKTPAALISRNDLCTALSNILSFLYRQRSSSVSKSQPVVVCTGSYNHVPCITISDPSLTLSEEERLRIFDPRIQTDKCNGHTLRLDIGLALSHHLVLRHGGELSVDTVKSGGLLFRLALKPAGSNPCQI